MSTQLFEGQELVARSDALAFPRYRWADDRKRTIGVISDRILPRPAEPKAALAEAMARRPLTAPRPQPPAHSLIAASSQSLGLSCSSARSLGRHQLGLPKSHRQTAMERAARWGSRLPTSGAAARPNLDDYAHTGLRAYRPRHVLRNSLGWIETDAAAQSGEGWESPTPRPTAHLHVRFSNSSGTPRPPGAHASTHPPAQAQPHDTHSWSLTGSPSARLFAASAAARGRLPSGRGGDQLGGSHARPGSPVAVEASAELAASTRAAALDAPGGRITTRSIAVETSQSCLCGSESGAEQPPPLDLLSSSSAALVATRREISRRNVHSRKARRADLATPRLVPPGRFVSDATVRRLARRCREDIAVRKRVEDEAALAAIAAEEARLIAEEEARLFAEREAAWQREQEESRVHAARLAEETRLVRSDTIRYHPIRYDAFAYRLPTTNHRAS